MYRKNVASQYVYFALVNATTGAALTGATVTARIALDAAAQATATGTTTELGNGHYRFNLSQADTNADYVGLLFTATNAIPVSANFVTTGGNFASAAAFGMTNLDAAISTRATPAQVNTEVLDVMTVDTFAQPGQEAPAATTTLHGMIRYMYKMMRNKLTNDGSTVKLFADNGSTIDQKASVSEASGTVTRDKFGTGP